MPTVAKAKMIVIAASLPIVRMIADMDTAQVRRQATELLEQVRVADGRAPETVPWDDCQPMTRIVDGQLAALAWRVGSDSAELYVAPAWRRRGIGRHMAQQLLADGSGAGIWAHGTFPPATALATDLGLVAGRTLLQLAADLPIPMTAPVPEGIIIRPMVIGTDDDEFLAVNAAAFAWHPEQGRLDAAGFAAERAQEWFDEDGFFVAEAATNPGTLLGFHWTKIHREVSPAVGEVYVIGVHPERAVRRLGSALLSAGLDYLAQTGLGRVILYVEADNERAVRLYERFGFSTAQTDTVFELASAHSR